MKSGIIDYGTRANAHVCAVSSNSAAEGSAEKYSKFNRLETDGAIIGAVTANSLLSIGDQSVNKVLGLSITFDSKRFE